MDTQHHDIVKLPETTTPTKSTILNSYFVRTIEILKSIIISIEIPRDAVKLIMGTCMAIAIIFFLFNWGNTPHGLNPYRYQLRRLADNIELTANDRSQAILADYQEAEG
ncbi:MULTISPECIES: hypothetical protein [unclassified Anabaena]|uniref:hypothetical protein n=1 Tax=unclassified Anabaena TaxID=2619674 RepID=UPI0039C6AED2